MSCTPAIIYNGQQFTGPSSVGSSGQPFISDGAGNLSVAALDLSGAGATGTLAAARFPALTGAITTSAGSLTTSFGQIAAYSLLGNTLNGAAAPTALSAFNIGGLGNYNSVDPVITISRQLNTGTGNGHAFSDSSNFDRKASSAPYAAYNSYDARITLGSSGGTYDHFAAFQSIPAINGGTLNLYYGAYSQLAINNSAAVGSAYHFYAADLQAGSVGTVTNQYGLYVPGFTSSGTSYSLYSASESVQLVHNGPLMLGGTGFGGPASLSPGPNSLSIGFNVWYDQINNGWYPLAVSSSYSFLQLHLPGTNGYAMFCGPTPSSLSTAISSFPVAFRGNYTGSNGWFSVGSSGVQLFGSTANMLQFGGVASTNPAILSGSNLLTIIGADNSTACGLTVTGTLIVNGHNTLEGVTSTGATGTGNLVFSFSPTFTGVPAAPTASPGTNTTQLATTAFVAAAVSGIGGGSPGGTNGQIQYDNSGSFGGFTVGGDGTLVPSTGVLTVTKSNGVSFGSAAFAATSAFDAAGSAAAITLAGLGGLPVAIFYFGDGSDGSVTLPAGTTTLTRDMYYQNLTHPGGTTVLNTAGYRIFVAGTLDLSACTAGGIVNNGAAGGTGGATGVAGSGGASGGVGQILVAQSTNAATAGSTTTATGPSSGNGSGNMGGQSATSGAGGSGSSGSGGASAVSTSNSNVLTIRRFCIDFVRSVTSTFCCGTPHGGSGGGGDGSNSGGGGGGYGGGGGMVWISAATIARGTNSNTGIIQAKGGAGGGGGSPTAGNAGGGGGGAGSSGGWVYLAYGALTGSTITGAIDVSSGAGGAGGNGHGTGIGGGGGGSAGTGRVTLVNIVAGTTSDPGTTLGSPTTGGSQSAGTGGTGASANVLQVNL